MFTNRIQQCSSPEKFLIGMGDIILKIRYFSRWRNSKKYTINRVVKDGEPREVWLILAGPSAGSNSAEGFFMRILSARKIIPLHKIRKLRNREERLNPANQSQYNRLDPALSRINRLKRVIGRHQANL